jgi:Family of unknown function (DUF6370)
MTSTTATRLFALTAVLTLLACQAGDQATTGAAQPPALRAEVACGECQFDLPGTGCHLALRLKGICYWVDGVGLDDLGDAHAADGLCNAIRQAEVRGQVADTSPEADAPRFQAESVVLSAE